MSPKREYFILLISQVAPKIIATHTMTPSDYIDPDNCALDAQGNLKNAEDIVFYESATEDIPIQSSSRKGKDKAGPSSTSALLSHM